MLRHLIFLETQRKTFKMKIQKLIQIQYMDYRKLLAILRAITIEKNIIYIFQLAFYTIMSQSTETRSLFQKKFRAR
jgi:hypothetical protein